MDKWFKILNESRRDQRPRPEPTPFKSKAQKSYKKQRRKNDVYSTVSGHKNLSSGAPFNNKTQRAGTDRLRFEDVDPSTFEKQDTLNEKFWRDNGSRLCRKVAKRLVKISEDFINGLDVPVYIEDIRFTGSLANYNWSKYSDVDLHIVVDFSKIDEDIELVKSFFDSARMRWNDIHNIKIYGYEVEIYVENVGDVHKSSGIYSIMNEQWVAEPDPTSVDIDVALARKKSDDIETQVNLIKYILEKEKYHSALRAVDRLKEKIRRMRKAGLDSPKQEFSPENIAFKILRREDILQKLNDLKYDAYDRMMSIK
tara:strand:- start:2855 stop:3787 length:933 start_codon:yes stop_codon:yes gene_type:complete